MRICIASMNELQEELNLLKVLAGACAQVRRMGSAVTAKVAIRWEERLLKDQDKLAAKLAEQMAVVMAEPQQEQAAAQAFFN